MRKGALAGIGVAALVFVAFAVWSAFQMATRPSSDAHGAGTPLTPPGLEGFKLVQSVKGQEALTAIEHLHGGKNIAMTDGYYATYRSTKNNAELMVWVAASDSPAGAIALNRAMLDKMGGSKEFSRPELDKGLPGEVYTTRSQGTVHWFGVYGTSVYWISMGGQADGQAFKPLLDAVWKGLPKSSFTETADGGITPGPTSSTPAAPKTYTEQQALRTNAGGPVEIGALFLNALGKEKPGTLSFEIGFTTHSVDLSKYDLTQLAFVKDNDGRVLKGFTWVSESDDPHHRAGILKVANVADGKPFATAQSGTLTLVLKDIEGVPSREFTWAGEYLAALGEGK